jgi:uncharacterized phage infection (PIP) family protein YhgE
VTELRVRRAAGIVAGLAIAMAGGCGGGGDGLSKEEYEQQVQEVGGTLNEVTAGLQETPTSLDDLAAAIADIRTEAEQAADELDDIEPPDEVADSHDKLTAGLRQFADDLAELEQSVEDGELQEIEQLATQLASSEGIQQLTEATNELESKGYNIGE